MVCLIVGRMSLCVVFEYTGCLLCVVFEYTGSLQSRFHRNHSARKDSENCLGAIACRGTPIVSSDIPDAVGQHSHKLRQKGEDLESSVVTIY
jgi:hypothetical protein